MPNQVTKSSGKRVWWKCSNCNYEWEANINNRIRTSGKCPNCKINKKAKEQITSYL